MNYRQLVDSIRSKNSFLCIGLDSDPNRLPKHLLSCEDPLFEFNRQIIEATHDLCIAYKPNLAFYECIGPDGWISLEKTLAVIPEGILTIADAKRGDIGNTSERYARTFFERYRFDAVTVNPYMGADSVYPFLAFENKWVILLALTSNTGAADFQMLISENNQPLFSQVITKSSSWAGPDKMMYVVGATHASQLSAIRKLIPDYFLLIPGVGAQGGSLSDVCRYGMTPDIGLIVNASRSILYAGQDLYFADRAREEALRLQQQMEAELRKYS